MKESLSQALEQEPFAAFSISLTNVERFEVGNPNLLVIRTDHVRYFIPKSNGYSDINFVHIVTIDVQDAEARS